MILTKTPLRISLAGGGTDYPEFYRQNYGHVVGLTIDKFVYVSVRKLPPYFEHKHRIVWSKIETVNAISEIELPPVRAALEFTRPVGGLEIHYDADLPARSGMGSSSSYMVGLLHALRALNGHTATAASLTQQAIHLEREVLKEAGGHQDQVWAAYGGMKSIRFYKDGSIAPAPIIMGINRRRQLESNFLLFYLGKSRNSYEVAAKQVANMVARQNSLERIHELANLMHNALTVGELNAVGEILHENWMLKRELADGISTTAIDEVYDRARTAGALGGKLLGAGGGGFLLFYAPEDRHPAIRGALDGLLEVPFKIWDRGSEVVVYEPNGV